MNEAQAKKQLKKMLGKMTPGSILHLLSDIFKESAEQASRDGDSTSHRQFKLAEGALFVVGLGIDAAVPQ
jgi:hypothetical protein